MRGEPDMEQAAGDLAFAAGYDGADADPVISAQAEDLLDTITE